MTGRAGGFGLLLLAALALLAVWAMSVGGGDIGLGRVFAALATPGTERADLIVTTVRLPRVLAAVAVGAALAVAGGIMQAMTANPLAEPGLLGVNAGAAFGVVIAIAFLDVTATRALVWIAFLGAALAAAAVHALGRGAAPIRLVLAGVVVTTFLGALTASILVLDAQTLDTVRLWTAGSLAGRRMPEIATVLPYLVPALCAALLASRHFTTMSLGADAAAMLGQSPLRWRAAGAAIVVGLAGGAVALAGPLGFVGLLAPHIARRAVGGDYQRLLPIALLAGAILALAADTLPRALLGRDVPAGVTLTLIGAPVLVWIARRRTG
ncbi:MAG: iron ABC transporter permease [Rhodovulum sulfidophilum]|uniref:Iron ABC transporter permease n=1 Tax=Rhodovulum sulfidophilum TaxID=35806 RepID=A0A2W5N8D8_RHOSU|nr:MAG: iron ABC transporter permease [Rhodovulum sulfidophilum]